MLVIGLTGGIGSGKSTVSGVMADLGATVIDADKVGHQALKPKTPAWHDIVAAFGRGVLKENEEVDRAKLGQIVFSDPKALKRLNAIMHPRMSEMMRERLAALKAEGVGVVVLEAALLIEA
ncbi:MAG: dephospho-CoA kinase, partial [Chloroflexota bacterium]|nr:dephospho-CoA kinase [Chloroflexota bacterium]